MECSGYGINWNPNKIGQLVAGDMEGKVTVLANNENYTSWSKQTTYSYHKGSVEDIMFSPDQDFVFASCTFLFLFFFRFIRPHPPNRRYESKLNQKVIT